MYNDVSPYSACQHYTWNEGRRIRLLCAGIVYVCSLCSLIAVQGQIVKKPTRFAWLLLSSVLFWLFVFLTGAGESGTSRPASGWDAGKLLQAALKNPSPHPLSKGLQPTSDLLQLGSDTRWYVGLFLIGF